MSYPQDNPLVPSLQDQLCDSATRGFSFADEQPADAFPPEPEYTADEEQEMYEQHMARLAEDARRAAACAEAFRPLAEAAERVKRQLAASRIVCPAGYIDAVCIGCGDAVFVESGGDALCPACAATEVA